MTENVTYAFVFRFKVGGLIDSPLSHEDSLTKLKEELTQFYGTEGVEILEFRKATDEEVSAYHEYIEAEETPATIN